MLQGQHLITGGETEVSIGDLLPRFFSLHRENSIKRKGRGTMQVNRKPSGLAMSIPGALTLSCILALILTLISSAILAKLIEIQRVSEQNIGYSVMGILTAVSFLCARFAAERVKHQRLLVCISAGAVYWGGLLAITALFFGGQYEAVGETGLLILCGSGAAALVGLHGTNRGTGRKRRRNRH